LREIRSLLASHEEADEFLEQPAIETAPDLLESDRRESSAAVSGRTG
jgi:hypothetical protein